MYDNIPYQDLYKNCYIDSLNVAVIKQNIQDLENIRNLSGTGFFLLGKCYSLVGNIGKSINNYLDAFEHIYLEESPLLAFATLKSPILFKDMASIGILIRGFMDHKESYEYYHQLMDLQLKYNIVNASTIIQRNINLKNYNYYLEIGIDTGVNFFQIQVKKSVGIDIEKKIQFVFNLPKNTFYYQSSVENYFSKQVAKDFPEGIDIIFIRQQKSLEDLLTEIDIYLSTIKKDGCIVFNAFSITKSRDHREKIKTAIQKTRKDIVVEFEDDYIKQAII